MNYQKLGRSNLTISKIALGTMFFGGWTDDKEAFRIMDKALDIGINFFDTADVYPGFDSFGRTEEILGKWLAADRARRDKVVLATKVYWPDSHGKGFAPNEERGVSSYKVRKYLRQSLERLQTDHIDLYQVHHIDRRVTLEEFWSIFERLEDNGDILYLGTSNFPGWALAKYQMYARSRGRLGLVSEQTQYNLLNRAPELEVIPACQDFGIGLIPYMPLGGGLLAGKIPTNENQRSHHVAKEYGLDPSSEQFSQFSDLCRSLGESEVSVAIAWVLANPAVSSTIVGVRKIEHLNGLERAAELQLDDETMEKLDHLFDINEGRPLQKGASPEAYAW